MEIVYHPRAAQKLHFVARWELLWREMPPSHSSIFAAIGLGSAQSKAESNETRL